jgi:uncharacterized membrane protein YoaK (UPF0700 family)
VLSNVHQNDTWVSFELAFVGGYGDAASFVLAKTFTGHVTGNLVLTAAIAAHDWRAALEPLSAIVTFLIGISLSVLIVRPLKARLSGAFRRVGGISVHTTYLTGMITSLISTTTERHASEVTPLTLGSPDPKVGLLCGIWIAFVLGAGTGTAMVLHFKALGMLGAALLLIPLLLREVQP